MGHLVGKDLYRKLGKKIDGLGARAPWNETFYAILKELYTGDEADLIIRMPYGLNTFDHIQKVTKYEPVKLKKLLDGLCDKGLVVDAWFGKGFRYIASPMVIGIFEFTMMRTGGNLNTKEWAKLFHDYLQDKRAFYRANLGHGEKVGILRAIPHEEAIDTSDYVEVLNYEKASAIIEDSKKFAVGICSCRHEKLHAEGWECRAPLNMCTSLDASADYLIRHGLAEESSKSETLEILARSRELGLVLSGDNVKRNVSFICMCCGCCCNVLLGVSKFGYPNAIVTSTYIAESDRETCSECGNCAEACPIHAIEMVADAGPEIDENICMGCGVCALDCSTGAMKLVKRDQRVLHPEDTFERVILGALERGNLQNLLFNNPQSVSHRFMRGLIGGFLKLPPVKRSLMGDTLRSRFLEAMKRGT